MRDRMIQAAEEIKESYNAQPRFAETGAIDNILGVAGGNKIDLVMQTVNDDLDTEEVAKRLRERLGISLRRKTSASITQSVIRVSQLRCSLHQKASRTWNYLQMMCAPHLKGIPVCLI